MLKKIWKNIKPLLFFPVFLGKMNEKDYVHIIHTHFNLSYNNLIINSPKDQYKNPEWLKERFILFEEYCLPSIMSQTDKNFIWVCHVHEDTPEEFKNKFDEYKKLCPQLDILYGNYSENFYKDLTNYINALPQKKYLVTTRFDSDDNLARDFVETIHKNLHKGLSYFIDCIYGYIYDAQNKKLYHTKFRRNPFCSKVEKMKNYKTVYSHEHCFINQVSYVLQIKDKPMWMQVIHGDNILNKVDGDIQEDLTDFKSRFSINEI